MKSKIRRDTIIWVIGLITITSLLIAAVLNNHDITVYTLEGDSSVQLQIKDGEYTLNGERMVYQSRGFAQELLDDKLLFILLGAAIGVLATLSSTVSMHNFRSVRVAFNIKLKEKPVFKTSLLPPNPEITGFIATRVWRERNGLLKSMATDDVWESTQKEADLEPCVGGWHGIHAFRLGANRSWDWLGDVAGIVSLSGTIIGHRDNLLRAQRCLILTLLTTKRERAERLKRHYSCPVIVVPEIKQAIERFALSPDGIYWLNQNNKLIPTVTEEV